MVLTVTHASLTGAAANPNVLVDGPKWDAEHTISGFDTIVSLVASRSAMSALSVEDGAKAFVSEVSAEYVFSSESTATADNWCIIAGSSGGRWIISSDSLTLPIIGGTSDDWPNFGAANAACAPLGVTLKLGAGTYNAKSRQSIATKSHIVLDPMTVIHAAIPVVDNRDSVFNVYASVLATDTIAANTNIGDKTVTITGSTTFAVGDHIVLNSKQFRTAQYKVVAWNAGTKVVTLDRPLLMPYGSALATTSFPSGSPIWKIESKENVRIEANGARLYGSCDRFVEFFCTWKCDFIGPVYCGDGTTTTATERIFSFDESCFDCHAWYVSADGGGLTSIGLSFESTENCTFHFCDMRNMVGTGVIFQDAINSYTEGCNFHNSPGTGVIFTAAAAGSEPDSGTVWGSFGCSVIGGSATGNYGGVKFERGSSYCSIGGNAVIESNTNGVLDTLGNYNSLDPSVVVRNNFNGVYLDSGSVGFESQAKISHNTNGVQIIAGSSGSRIPRMPFLNVTNDVLGAPGRITLPGALTVSNTTASTSTTTGALVVAGGAGVAGAIHATNLISHGQMTSQVADGTYSALLTGATKAVRVSHSATESSISGTDPTGSSSYQPLYFNGSALGFQVSGALKGTLATDFVLTCGLVSTSPTSGIGYATGAGGTVTQATSKATGVTLNKVTGAITLNNASLAAATSVAFTLTNSAIAATDLVHVNIKSGATANSYSANVDSVSAGSCSISLRNYSAGALAEAVVLSFAVLKGVVI